jgi:mono/diheme cytochrome c family protein
MHRFSAALIMLWALAPSAWGQDRASAIEAGRDLADRLCARCHAVGADDEGLHKQAPPFRTFTRMWPLESLDEALAEGITVGHPDMPEFVLEPDEIAALIAYLESLE